MIKSLGLVALIQELGLQVPLPTVRSETAPGHLSSFVIQNVIYNRYPHSYATEGLLGNLRFALRYEPVDLCVLQAAFQALPSQDLAAWVREEKTSIFARRAWYLYEQLTGNTLDVPDIGGPVLYADVLDPAIHITGPSQRSRRHRVNDNLLGDAATYCPLLRRTPTLEQSMQAGLSQQARELVYDVDPSVVARAVQFLYTKETKSSFAIEGEVPTSSRTERFVAALSHAADFNPLQEQAFVELQNLIVDPRYAASGWRTLQNYVGQTGRDYQPKIHYVCPKPEDVPGLMAGWMRMVERLLDSTVDPVCAAVAASFGFVLIHPFDDGNGRIHRFLIHHTLAQAGFTPPGLLFPVSAAMLRDQRHYDQVLQQYSSAILPFTEYKLDDSGAMTVHNATAPLYRYWDATAFAEYLYECVAETIRHDLTEEINFLQIFDRAVRNTMEIVDMPDRRASLLVQFILQNQGSLSKAKRGLFAELHDEEIAAIEEAVRSSRAMQTK